jgi:hypothetical protein
MKPPGHSCPTIDIDAADWPRVSQAPDLSSEDVAAGPGLSDASDFSMRTQQARQGRLTHAEGAHQLGRGSRAFFEKLRESMNAAAHDEQYFRMELEVNKLILYVVKTARCYDHRL